MSSSEAVPIETASAAPAANAAVTARRDRPSAGWATIVSLPAGTVPAHALNDPLVGELTQSVGGGRALSTSLVSVLITADGRVFAGSVPVSALQSAAQ